MPHALSRRRFIGIIAAAAGLPLLPIAPARGEPSVRIWRGTALGADAVLQVHHPDPQIADGLIQRCLTEVERLEKIFSLYRPDSTIIHFNRNGRVDDPPMDFVRLLDTSASISRLTGGAFDPTVQPLWQLYVDHFARSGADPDGPKPADIERALALVGHEAIEIGPALVRFRRKGMAITLNGIAQGYVTDRIVDLLWSEGVDRSLVDMGEIRAIGGQPGGGPWSIGLEDPMKPGRIAEHVALENRAIATSGGYGFQFDAAGRFTHLLDPHTGASAHRYCAVSVMASTATMADALSTAFSAMPAERAEAIVKRFGLSARFVLADRSVLRQAA